MKQARMVKPCDPAKNFSLKDQNDKTFDLYEQDGKRTLLSSALHTKSLKIFPLPGEMGGKAVVMG
jgi:hypothetical protein